MEALLCQAWKEGVEAATVALKMCYEGNPEARSRLIHGNHGRVVYQYKYLTRQAGVLEGAYLRL